MWIDCAYKRKTVQPVTTSGRTKPWNNAQNFEFCLGHEYVEWIRQELDRQTAADAGEQPRRRGGGASRA